MKTLGWEDMGQDCKQEISIRGSPIRPTHINARPGANDLWLVLEPHGNVQAHGPSCAKGPPSFKKSHSLHTLKRALLPVGDAQLHIPSLKEAAEKRADGEASAPKARGGVGVPAMPTRAVARN